jgi:hypothetical protein
MPSKLHLDVSGAESVECELGGSLPQAATKLQGYVRSTCRMYARRLRHEYKDNTIRNAFVFESTIRELSRLGYIALVVGRIHIPTWVPEALVYTIKRVKYHPIWMPTLKLLYSDASIFAILLPTIEDGKIVWHYSPGRARHQYDEDDL